MNPAAAVVWVDPHYEEPILAVYIWHPSLPPTAQRGSSMVTGRLSTVFCASSSTLISVKSCLIGEKSSRVLPFLYFSGCTSVGRDVLEFGGVSCGHSKYPGVRGSKVTLWFQGRALYLDYYLSTHLPPWGTFKGLIKEPKWPLGIQEKLRMSSPPRKGRIIPSLFHSLPSAPFFLHRVNLITPSSSFPYSSSAQEDHSGNLAFTLLPLKQHVYYLY
jgi:hypothetical protein